MISGYENLARATFTCTPTVLALRDSLRQADALGLPRNEVLDILELGRLGALVGPKRTLLTSEPATTPAEFTIDALTKDMNLLAAASKHPLRSAAGLAHTPADPEADIAAAATAPAAHDAVLEPLHAYIRTHATGQRVNGHLPPREHGSGSNRPVLRSADRPVPELQDTRQSPSGPLTP
ncbi:hypothetical protein [Streptomyces sp. NPDC004728]|uniref:hypothetical protein n=1 Tax=Streptomyces sp. NPDC004728 TaxID=3154289 RepID=UPI00339E80BF